MEMDFSSEMIEKLLLKRALNDKSWLNILTNIYDKRWFKVKNLGTIMKLVITFYNKYSTIPSIKVIQALIQKHVEKSPDTDIKLSEVNELLSEVTNLDLNVPDDVLNMNFKEFIRRNAFFNSLWDNAALLEKDQSSYEKVVDKCLENFDRVQKITFNDTDLGLNYFDEAAMSKHWEYIKNPEAKIKTLWMSLDNYTNGGFLKDGKMLALFMAQAGLGKSVFMSNLAVNFLKQNLGVVVISLEMSQDVYAQRFDAHISNKNINKLSENAESAISSIKAFYEKYPKASLYLKEYPPRSISSRDIEQYLENLRNAGKTFDVVIVDYLNLVLPNRKTDSMFKDGMAVSEELRAISYKFNCPVISAVQSNTDGMNTADIDMQNVSESRGICHTADFIAALYQVDDDRDKNKINLKLIKNRLGGMVGKRAQFMLHPETLTLADMTFDNNFDTCENEDTELGKIVKNIKGISSAMSQDNLDSI